MVMSSQRGFERILSRGRYQFNPSHKDTHSPSRSRIYGQRQDCVDKRAGHYIEKAAAFLTPGVLPGLYHGVRFVLKEAACLQHLLEISVERFDIRSQLRRLQRDLVPKVVENSVSH